MKRTSSRRARRVRYPVVGLGRIAQDAVLPAIQNARSNGNPNARVSNDPEAPGLPAPRADAAGAPASSRARLETIVHVLAEAFEEEPVMAHALPASRRRRRALTVLQGLLCSYARRFGVIDVSPDAEAAAIWLPPGGEQMTVCRMMRCGMAKAPFLLGPRQLWRIARFASHKRRLHKRSIEGAHWYLLAIGVSRSRRGTGLGGRLLEQGLARADASGFPCYLETAAAKSVCFFARHGFEVVDCDWVPDGPRFWGMVRQARWAPAAGSGS